MLCAGGTDIGKKGKWVKTDRVRYTIPGVTQEKQYLIPLCPVTTHDFDFSEELYYLGPKVGVLVQLSLGNGLWSGVGSIFSFDS